MVPSECIARKGERERERERERESAVRSLGGKKIYLTVLLSATADV